MAELQEELETLIASRGDIANKLKTARDHGDLRENAEYHNAREEQANMESRISEIENILKNVEIVKQPARTAETRVRIYFLHALSRSLYIASYTITFVPMLTWGMCTKVIDDVPV